MGAALVLTGCTLTSEAYDPSIVDPIQAEGSLTADPPGVTSPAESGDDEGPAPVDTPGDGSENIPSSVGLDPGETDEGQLGGINGPSSPGGINNGPRGDAGVSSQEPAPPAATTEPDAGAPPAPAAEPCPGPTFEGSCYQFFGQLAEWDDAEDACVGWGGHLASVASLEEDAFLDRWPVELGIAVGSGSGIWLGGTDIAQNDVFEWTDETPSDFMAWAQNQPDNAPGAPDCIEKRNDGTQRWYDQRCTALFAYVCERPQ